MSLTPSSRWRGCASSFEQPLSGENQRLAQFRVMAVHYFNCYVSPYPSKEIVYRNSHGDGDVVNHVFCWDMYPYNVVFEKGIYLKRNDHTPEQILYDLAHHVGNNNRFLESREGVDSFFISTSMDSSKTPAATVKDKSWVSKEIYRYEIYAPGGIWVLQSLRMNGREEYNHVSHNEVCFVAGIAPQYIRSAQKFRVVHNGNQTRCERVSDSMVMNGHFNPQSHPERRLQINLPVHVYKDATGTTKKLSSSTYRPNSSKNPVGAHMVAINDWYTRLVAEQHPQIPEVPQINAGFRCTEKNQGYIFIKNTCLLLEFSKDPVDRLLKGPVLISHEFPALAGTAFSEYGVDCAFGTHEKHKAFVFSGNLCAKIDYTPGSARHDKVLRGPTTIGRMFPFLKRTVFESSVDAAFEHHQRKDEAFLFKGDQYAHIYYGWGAHLRAMGRIREGFPILENSIFQNGFESAIASHVNNEVYIFRKFDYGVFSLNIKDDHSKKIHIGTMDKWPALFSEMKKRSNAGFDVLNYKYK